MVFPLSFPSLLPLLPLLTTIIINHHCKTIVDPYKFGTFFVLRWLSPTPPVTPTLITKRDPQVTKGR
jgi:hypothetical protein